MTTLIAGAARRWGRLFGFLGTRRGWLAGFLMLGRWLFGVRRFGTGLRTRSRRHRGSGNGRSLGGGCGRLFRFGSLGLFGFDRLHGWFPFLHVLFGGFFGLGRGFGFFGMRRFGWFTRGFVSRCGRRRFGRFVRRFRRCCRWWQRPGGNLGR